MAEITKTRMTAAEFMKLQESNLPIELIDGEVIVSPTPKFRHQKLIRLIVRILEEILKIGEIVISPMDVHLDDGNIVQPDIFWVSGPDSLCKLGEDDYW